MCILRLRAEADLGKSVFISEITARAFIIADSNKRRTLSRSDIAKALSKSDQFDFLIDIVPRDDAPFTTPSSNAQASIGSSGAVNGPSGSGDTIASVPDQVRPHSDFHFL